MQISMGIQYMVQVAFLVSGIEMDSLVNGVKTTDCYFLLVARAGEGIVRPIPLSLSYKKF